MFQWSTDMTQSTMHGAKDVKFRASSNTNCFNPSNHSTESRLLSRNSMVPLRTEPRFNRELTAVQKQYGSTKNWTQILLLPACIRHYYQKLHSPTKHSTYITGLCYYFLLLAANTNYKSLTAQPLSPPLPTHPPAAHPQLQVHYSITTNTIKKRKMYQWILMGNFCR